MIVSPEKEITILDDWYKANSPIEELANIHRTHNDKEITFEKHNYLRQIYQDKSDEIVIKKSSQSGISEWLIIYAINESIAGRTVLYILPTYDLKNMFVNTRLNPSIGHTEYYRNLINEAKQSENYYKQSESTSIKNFLDGTIIFVGTHSDKGLIAHPSDTNIIDEWDKCDQNNLALAPARQSHSAHPKTIKVSNPTIEGFGIDDEYNKSDKKKWHIKCSHCRKYIQPDFFEHVVREIDQNTFVVRDPKFDAVNNPIINPICDKCEKPFERYAEGEWREENKSHVSGYSINKVFSSLDSLFVIVNRFNEGLANDTKLQTFYNMDLGQAYTPTGSKIDTNMLDECVCDHPMIERSENICIAGFDVGSKIHVIVAEIINEKLKIIYIREILTKADIIDIIIRYKIRCFVIDAMPETRLSRSLCMSYPGGFMAYFTRQKVPTSLNAKEKIINSQRTTALDAIKEMLILKQIMLPKNAKSIKDFYDHMTASTRVFVEDKNEYIWTEGNKPDHYFTAMAYLILARKILAMVKR